MSCVNDDISRYRWQKKNQNNIHLLFQEILALYSHTNGKERNWLVQLKTVPKSLFTSQLLVTRYPEQPILTGEIIFYSLFRTLFYKSRLSALFEFIINETVIRIMVTVCFQQTSSLHSSVNRHNFMHSRQCKHTVLLTTCCDLFQTQCHRVMYFPHILSIIIIL